MTTTSEPGYAVIRSFEGRSLKAYRDEVGVWTIGFGNTNFDAEVLGFKIEAGVTITETQCEQLLRAAMTRRYEPAVNKAMPDATQAAFDAGGSFHYNTGAVSRASWVKSYVEKNLPAVHSQIMQWNRAGGNVLAGLTRRRNREWMMISANDYGPEGREPARDMTTGKPVGPAPTPPAPSTASPAAPVIPGNGAGTYPGMMRLGDRGPELAEQQVLLKALGYTVPTDGYFETLTERAVREVQTAHPQLRVDGVLGPATRTALKRDADLKSKVGTVAGRGGGTAVVTTAVDAASHGSLSMWVWVVLGVCIAGSLAAVAWSYRDEISAMLRR